MSKDTVLRITEDENVKLNKIFNIKSEKEIESYLESLKQWIKKEQHLPENEDDQILKLMLLLNKCSVESTKSKLEVYYSAKNFMPEYFTNNYPLHPCIQKYLDTSFFLPLPLLSPNLERITVISFPKQCSINDFEPVVLIRIMFAIAETRLINDLCTGEIHIIDLTNLNFGIASKITPRFLQNSYNYFLGAYSDRIKHINFINVPTFAHTLIAIVKTIMKSKIAERVQVHNNTNSLLKCIPPEILPSDFGGTLKSLKELQANWRTFLESHNDWIIKRSNMKSNEKLRSGTPVSSDLFGIQGSFQQLNID